MQKNLLISLMNFLMSSEMFWINETFLANFTNIKSFNFRMVNHSMFFSIFICIKNFITSATFIKLLVFILVIIFMLYLKNMNSSFEKFAQSLFSYKISSKMEKLIFFKGENYKITFWCFFRLYLLENNFWQWVHGNLFSGVEIFCWAAAFE